MTSTCTHNVESFFRPSGCVFVFVTPSGIKHNGNVQVKEYNWGIEPEIQSVEMYIPHINVIFNALNFMQ